MLVPGDFEVDAAAIARKRKVLDAMMAQGMKGADGQMVSGHYVAPSAFEHLSNLTGVLLGAYGNKDLDKDEAKNNAKYQEGLGSAVQDYLTTRNGGTAAVDNQGPMPDGSAMEGQHVEQTPGDPRKAVINAMTSQYKPLQQLGAAELAQLGKGTLTTKDILSLPNYSAKSKLASVLAGGDPSLLQPENKDIVVNNKLVRSNGEDAPTEALDGRDTFNPVGSIGTAPDGTPILGQTEKTTGKAAFAPKGVNVSVDTSTNKGANAFAEAASNAAVKKMTESQAAAEKAQHSFEVYQNAKSQIGKVAGGTGADVILTAKKFAQMLGVPVGDDITSQEQVAAALGQGVLDNSKLLGSGNGFTDKDREFLEKIVAGKITLDHATLKRAVDIGLAQSINAMRSHDKLVDKALQAKGADPAVMEQFRVRIPHYSLDDNFDFDEGTGRLVVKTSGGGTPTPAPAKTPPRAANTAPPSGAWTPAMEARYQELLKKHGGNQ